jgi:hypothetical protein
MTIDERLERPTERHETLTQSVELLLRIQRQNQVRFEKNEVRMGHVMDSMNRLINIVVSHENRLDDLESRS